LFLTGILASGRHGANPGEKDREQELVVDLDVEVAVTADEIGGTADYRELIRTARAVVAGQRFDLIENLADAIARADAARVGVVRATAVVHKPAAARSSDVQGIAAAATVDHEG
jgi:dihydroneopterin aldolase